MSRSSLAVTTCFVDIKLLLQAFAVIGAMNFLRIIVALIPFAMRAYGEVKVSFERLRVQSFKHFLTKILYTLKPGLFHFTSNFNHIVNEQRAWYKKLAWNVHHIVCK